MKTVFYLEHSYQAVNENEEVLDKFKILGIYSTREKAEKAVLYYKTLSGFKNYPNNFIIEGYKLNKNKYEGGISYPEDITELKGYMDDKENSVTAGKFPVFILQHYFENINKKGEEYSETRILGIYSSWKKGMLAKQYYKEIPGFKNLPDDCYYLEGYKSDDCWWLEGFIPDVWFEFPGWIKRLENDPLPTVKSKKINYGYPKGIGSEWYYLKVYGDYCCTHGIHQEIH